MKIYTKTGDEGETGLFAGPRVPKDDLRIEAYGAVDELNAMLGWVRSLQLDRVLDEPLGQIQHELFVVGAELATPSPEKLSMPLIGDREIERLEAWIDACEESLTPLRQFILPGGTPHSAAIHMARTVCRRAERRVVTLKHSTAISDQVLRYLNRLSDLLFVMARQANALARISDVPWQQPH